MLCVVRASRDTVYGEFRWVSGKDDYCPLSLECDVDENRHYDLTQLRQNSIMSHALLDGPATSRDGWWCRKSKYKDFYL